MNILDTILTMVTGFLLGKVIEIAIRDFKIYGYKLPSDKIIRKRKI
jgi:hypothetical protein